jgi:diadenosine tetraphosphate (Ap4A) HIT family hydrolase
MNFGKFQIEPESILGEDNLFAVILDDYPVSPGHSLVVVKREGAAALSNLSEEEFSRLWHWVRWCEDHLERTLQPKPDGFNIGLNDGPAAGQTVPQLHVHVIPRYVGDVADPRGGVRFVIPDKARYCKK